MLNAKDYRKWLLTQSIEESTIRNQLSRVRRLEGIFGDLDEAFAKDALRSVIASLEYSPADIGANKKVPPKLKWSGDIVSVMQTLRHAANTYRRYLTERTKAKPARGDRAGSAGRSGTKRPPPIIYFNIGWMREYAGPAADDKTIGAHGYLADHPHGAESYNFMLAADGTVRGYRPPGDREQINISRMGATRGQTVIDGALVVWLAREPLSGRTLIVGWYRNARVFRTARDGGITLNGERIHYSVDSQVADAVLLQPIARTFEVRSSRVAPGEGFGQKPTWYGAEPVDARVWAYIQSWGTARQKKKPVPSKSPPRNPDPELRRKVERAAVAHAFAYYKAEFGESCPIVSVETGAKGWDLEVHNSANPLLVEVKGLLNAQLICELTPNEYEKMMLRANRGRYVIYVVNNALAEHPAIPIASIFAHTKGRSWRTADGRELTIREKTGAVLSCS